MIKLLNDLIKLLNYQLFEEGNDDKHNLISPNDAPLYFTIKGLLFSKYISI